MLVHDLKFASVVSEKRLTIILDYFLLFLLLH